MGIMFVTSKNKNPMIKYDYKQPKNQKPQFSFVRNFKEICMKHVNNLKRKGYKGLTNA